MAVDIIIGALLGAGVAEGANALTKGAPKSPASTAPATPNAAAASTAASTNVNTSRAALLNSGGQTDETGGLGVLNGYDIATSALIGG